MNLMQLLTLILGAAENVVPIFIHNPQSQKIEGVVIGTVNGVLQGLQTNPVPAALKYWPSILPRTSSLLMMRISSLETRSMMGFGVPAGASTACHEIASKSG